MNKLLYIWKINFHVRINDVIIYNSSQKENFAMDIRLKINNYVSIHK